MVLADHRCKCTHLKSDHSKWHRICKKCPCSDYLQSNSPNLLSKFMLGFGIFVTALLLVGMVVFYLGLDALSPETMEKQINLTFEDLTIMAWYGFSLFVLMYWLIAILPTITRYFYEKQRKDYN